LTLKNKLKLIKESAVKWLGVVILSLIFLCSNQVLAGGELANSKLPGAVLSDPKTDIFMLSSLKLEGNVLHNSAASKEKRENGLDLGVTAGASVIDLQGESFGIKAVPVVGISLFPWVQIIDSLNLGAEVSLQYTFRSDYSNYYYYDSFGTFGVIPNLHLLLGESSVRFILLLGFGFGFSFSDYSALSYPVGCIGAGIRFNNGLISSILITYNHDFIESFQTFESLRLSANIRLLKNVGE
jgi:hypothetical protein